MTAIPWGARLPGSAILLAILLLPGVAAADCMNSCMSRKSCGLDYESSRIGPGYCSIAKNDCEVECRRGRNAQSFGAIAYGRTSGATGWSYSQDDEASAQRLALQYCAQHGKDCEVAASFANTCAAVAAGGDVVVAGRAAASEAAQHQALSACTAKGGGDDCEVKAWACSLP